MPIRYRHACIVSLLTILFAAPALAVDLQPGDLRAPKIGMNFTQFILQQSNFKGRYVHGQLQPGDPQLEISHLFWRVGRVFDAAGKPLLFFAQTPVSSVQPAGSLSNQESVSGIGDTTFLLALWPYANRETQTYFGVGAYLFAPTGNYHHDRNFNLGDNRYRGALQMGVQAPLTDRSRWMLALDTVWYGENAEFGQRRDTLEKAPLTTAQVSVQYDVLPGYTLAAGYFYSVGGETSLNATRQHDQTELHRYQLTGTAQFSFGKITLQYGGDLETENGWLEDNRLILRYTKYF
ncbi:transporter [Chromatium okenii]|jgi:hypothetical protein|uniref:Transporter n=1 Tax=Chromatium okenii TaxID=61644 RepID=A0A2S7XUL7_9GAMM|nr:transporter [Chromatium okenii]PQJ97292.1 hypothetical protein CXB77_02665 [Chromatium okenii]PQJ97346.1 hypothetical protein CXB77_02110 [Chromatium okenii]